MNKIVYDDVKVLFFDVGNTLISIDFAWVSEELSKRGIQCDAKTLQRAEAAARPEISSQINSVKNDPSIVVKVEKPNPKIFKIALEKANCKPKESLYIGDIYDIDILGANSVGMQAILIDPFMDWNGVDCECVPDLFTLAGKLQSIKVKD